MAGLQRRYDTLIMAQGMECLQRLIVGYSDIFRTIAVLEPRVFRSDTRIIQTGRNGVGLDNLSILILNQIGAISMQYTRPPLCQGSSMLAALDSAPCRFHADHAD